MRVMSAMPHNVCVCIYANFYFLEQGLQLDANIKTSSELLKAICCETDNENCMSGKCPLCYDVSDVKNLSADLNIETQWKQWEKSTDGWVQIQKNLGSRKELLEEIKLQTPKYKMLNVKKEQSIFLKNRGWIRPINKV